MWQEAEQRTLLDDTKRHWAATFGSDVDRLEAYVTSGLLSRELACGRFRGAVDKACECDVLVLLVGFSLEPLLQSICVYQPEQILLVLNETYHRSEGEVVGSDWGRTLQGLIGKVRAHTGELAGPAATFLEHAGGLETTEDKPGSVFQFLLRRALPLQHAGKRIVVDITGAKKSMVAGAYLFAAYAGVPVSYVDFDQYDPSAGRPLGYTCRIGLLENPYESFAIREWQAVERLYRHYAFGAALERVQTIRGAMRGKNLEGYFDPSQQEAVDRLVQIIAIYDLWESGDLHKAHELMNQRSGSEFACPSAITALGAMWPDPGGTTVSEMHRDLLTQFEALEKGAEGRLEEALYARDALLLVYGHDECERVSRIIRFRRDYRSAFLRAAALNETLVKARLVRMWLGGSLVVNGQSRAELDDAVRARLDSELVVFTTLWKMLHVLTGRRRHLALEMRPEGTRMPITPLECREDEPPDLNEVKFSRTETAPKLSKFWEGGGLSLGDLSQLRNKAIHSSLTIRKPLADEALRVVEANLAEFEQHWNQGTAGIVTPHDVVTTALKWRELCELCGIDFLPHRPHCPVQEAQ